MAVMLERWNDERMDDLAAKVDGIAVQLHEQRGEQRQEMQAQGTALRQETLELRREMKAGFDRVDRELRDHRQEMLELRKDMKAGFERVDNRFERVDERFERVEERFAKLERRITNAAIGLVGAIIVGFAALANGPL